MKRVLEYDADKYHILRDESFSSYAGDYRIIQYTTGLYALQELKDGSWITVLVSPLNENNGFVCVEEILKFIGEADRSFNGEYWMLCLYLSELGGENFTEIITRGDGEKLIGQVRELFELEREQRLLYLENYPMVYLVWGCCFLVFSVIVLVLLLKWCGVI